MSIELKEIPEYHEDFVSEEEIKKFRLYGKYAKKEFMKKKIEHMLVPRLIYNILAIQNSSQHKNRKKTYDDSKTSTIIKNSIIAEDSITFPIPEDSKSLRPFGPRLDICSNHFRLIKDRNLDKIPYDNPTLDPEYDEKYYEDVYLNREVVATEPFLQGTEFRNLVSSGAYGTSFKAYIKGTDITCRVKMAEDDEVYEIHGQKTRAYAFYAFMREIYYGLRYINPFTSIVPNFTETYGLYYCPTSFKKHKNIKLKCLLSHDYDQYYDLFLVTQQVENIGSLNSFIQNTSDLRLLITIIYQVICALELLERYNIYHGDSHGGNILIQKTDMESYLFPEKDGTHTRIKTYGYLARIIDYGFVSYDGATYELWHKYERDDRDKSAEVGKPKPDSRVFVDSILTLIEVYKKQDELEILVKIIAEPGLFFDSWSQLKKHMEKKMMSWM